MSGWLGPLRRVPRPRAKKEERQEDEEKTARGKKIGAVRGHVVMPLWLMKLITYIFCRRHRLHTRQLSQTFHWGGGGKLGEKTGEKNEGETKWGGGEDER